MRKSLQPQPPAWQWKLEVEAFTHALRWIASRGSSQTTHAVILTDSKSLLQKVKSGRNEWLTVVCVNVRQPLAKTPAADVLPWTCRIQGK